jgi:hypothetical protein
MLKRILIAAFLSSILFLLPSVFALDCTLCTVGACFCNVTECTTGAIDIFTAQCTGIPTKEITFTNNSFVWTGAQAKNYYFQVFCGDGQTKSNCIKVNLTSVAVTTTTSTTSSTTTTFQKLDCPFECCIGEANYITRYCSEGYECSDNQCIEIITTTSTTTEENNPPISLSLIGILIIVIMAAAFALYFFRNRKPHDKWQDLYKKYGRR